MGGADLIASLGSFMEPSHCHDSVEDVGSDLAEIWANSARVRRFPQHAGQRAYCSSFASDESEMTQIEKFMEKNPVAKKAMDSMMRGPPQIVDHGLPQNNYSPITSQTRSKLMMMKRGGEWPGGDVMTQSLWKKWVTKVAIPVPGRDQYAAPPEDKFYTGARLGEYARPPILGEEGEAGGLLQAPVPFGQSEDLLGLIAQAGVEARQARHAAIYAKTAVAQANEFYHLARRRAKQIFRAPPISVIPGSDVFPMYSAASPVPPPSVSMLAAAAKRRASLPPWRRRRRTSGLRRRASSCADKTAPAHHRGAPKPALPLGGRPRRRWMAAARGSKLGGQVDDCFL